MKLIQIIGFKSTEASSRKKLLLGGIVLFTILLIIAVYLTVCLLNNPSVYCGVYLDGVSMEGLDQAELMNYIEEKYQNDLSGLELNIFHKDYQRTVSFSELNARVNTQAISNLVYGQGRSGGIVRRLSDIFRLRKDNLYLNAEVSVNISAVDRIIDNIYEKTNVPAVPPSLLILSDEVVLRSGSRGYAVSKERLKKRILEQIQKLESGIVIVPVEEILPAKIDADLLYNEIIQEPQNAYVQVVDGEPAIIPEITGRSIDKAAFLSAVAELEAKSGKYQTELKLPVTFIKPEKTAEILRETLFKDILSTYTTSFPVKSQNDKNRSVNIRLATEAINGTILLPGESFSFNETVGKRTSDAGYLPANIYTYDGIAEGIGGGICQVSSTLYNAALEAVLTIDERNSHIYTVAYLPLGRDASVTYGTQDLRFTNSTSWPVRIEGEVKGSEVTFTIRGTLEDRSTQVIVEPYILKRIPYPTIYKEDKSIPPGKQAVKQAGMDGALVDTYYIVKNSQGIKSSSKLHTTEYHPLPEIVHVAPGDARLNNPN